MFTILMPDSRLMERFADFRPLFEPFIRRGELALCPWRLDGSGRPRLDGLRELAAGRRRWRALVLSDLPEAALDNPFDCGRDDPLPALSRMLGGRPRQEGDLSREQFDTGENRPAELFLLSTRYLREYAAEASLQRKAYLRDHAGEVAARRRAYQPDAETAQENPWEEFWQRGGYAWQSRFLVFDVHLDRERIPDRDLFLFWTAVLTLSLNEVSFSALQAFRLHRLELQLDEEGVARTMAVKCAEFVSIKNELLVAGQKRRELYPKELPKLMQHIPVQMDPAETGRLPVELKPRLFTDRPDSESGRWGVLSKASREAADRVIRAPRRQIEDAARQVRRQGAGEDLTVSSLSDRQQEDLLEETLGYESEMIRRCAPDGAVEKCRKALEEDDKRVRKVLRTRICRKDALIAFGLAAGLLVLSLLPWAVSELSNPAGLLQSLLWMAGSGLVLLLIWLLLLRQLKRPLREKLDAYNRDAAALVEELDQRRGRMSAVLTDTCSAMRGWSVLNRLTAQRREEEERARRCERHLQALERCYGQYSAWAGYFGYRVRDYLEPTGFIPFSPDLLPAENPAYRLRPDGGIRTGWEGEPLFAPYGFVRGFKFCREEVSDHDAE
ncbi:MAG: hypothetical protein PUC47_13320 [Oscillospiraceae bacterium]|nr:hypothetical protein [Oscillospiraceae bacterium]